MGKQKRLSLVNIQSRKKICCRVFKFTAKKQLFIGIIKNQIKVKFNSIRFFNRCSYSIQIKNADEKGNILLNV